MKHDASGAENYLSLLQKKTLRTEEISCFLVTIYLVQERVMEIFYFQSEEP